MEFRNWDPFEIPVTVPKDPVEFGYNFQVKVGGKWERHTVYGDVSKTVIAEWAGQLWGPEYNDSNLNEGQWIDIERIVFDEIQQQEKNRLQQGIFENRSTIEIRASISLPLDVKSLPHPRDFPVY